MRFKAKVNDEDRVCGRLQMSADTDEEEWLLYRLFLVLDRDCVESMMVLSDFFAEEAKSEVRHIERQKGKES